MKGQRALFIHHLYRGHNLFICLDVNPPRTTSTPIRHHNNPKNNTAPIQPGRRRPRKFPVSVRGTSGEPAIVVTVFVRGGHQSGSAVKGKALSCFMFTTLCFTRFGKIPHQSGVRLGRGREDGMRGNFRWAAARMVGHLLKLLH